MKRIAYVSIPATGHIFPSLPVVAEMRQRGFQVAYFTAARCHSLLERTKVLPVAVDSTVLPNPPRKLNGFCSGEIPTMAAQEIVHSFPSIRAALQEFSPSLVLYDGFTLAGRLAADSLQIPAVRCDVTHLPCPQYSYFRGCESGDLPGQVTTAESLQNFERTLEPLSEQYGWPRRTFHDLIEYTGDLTIAYMTRQLHVASGQFADSPVEFVGASLDPATRPDVGTGAVATQADVVVALGTIFQYEPALYLLLLEVLGRLPLRAVMAVGPWLREILAPHCPANVQLAGSINQLDLLSRARLLISHGGMGSVMETLYYRVPTLLIPQFPEQFLTARQIEKLQAGRMLQRDDVSLNSLSEAIEILLIDDSIHSGCSRLGRETANAGGFRRACDFLETML